MGELLPVAVQALSQPANVISCSLELLESRSEGSAAMLAHLRDASDQLADLLVLLRRAQVSEDDAAEVRHLLEQGAPTRPPA
jgi:hypothetical protein